MAQDPEVADAGGADAAPGGAARKARKPNPLANRIKRLMQTDEDVGKIAQASPALIGSALRHAIHAWHNLHVTPNTSRLLHGMTMTFWVRLQAGRWSCFWAACAEARTAWRSSTTLIPSPQATCE